MLDPSRGLPHTTGSTGSGLFSGGLPWYPMKEISPKTRKKWTKNCSDRVVLTAFQVGKDGSHAVLIVAGISSRSAKPFLGRWLFFKEHQRTG